MDPSYTARPLPMGTVIFMFTDFEGSTEMANNLGTSGFSELISNRATPT